MSVEDVAKLALDEDATAGFFKEALENERARQERLEAFKEEAKVFKQTFEAIVTRAVNAGIEKDVFLAIWKRMLLLDGLVPDQVEFLKLIESALPSNAAGEP
jgi:chromosome condensin MukBEF complex kleisin-like MukF subunit